MLYTEIKMLLSVRAHFPPLPVHSDGQQATHGCHDGDADHGVKHVIHLPDEVILHHQLSVVEEVNDDGFPGIGHTYQHVCYCQTATNRIRNASLIPSGNFALKGGSVRALKGIKVALTQKA